REAEDEQREEAHEGVERERGGEPVRLDVDPPPERGTEGAAGARAGAAHAPGHVRGPHVLTSPRPARRRAAAPASPERARPRGPPRRSGSRASRAPGGARAGRRTARTARAA